MNKQLSANDDPILLSASVALQQGARGEVVRAMQFALVQRGYSLPKYGVDGVYGKETASAVSQWKAENAQGGRGSFVTSSQLDQIGALTSEPGGSTAGVGTSGSTAGVGTGGLLVALAAIAFVAGLK